MAKAKTDWNAITATINTPVTLDWSHLFTPAQFIENGRPKGDPQYDATFIIDPDHPDLAMIREKAMNAYRSEWPNGTPTAADFPCLRAGNEIIAEQHAKGKNGVDYLEGKFVLRAHTKTPATLSVFEGGKITKLDNALVMDRAKPKFYRGVDVVAQLVFRPFTVGKQGVTCYLSQVMSYNTGEALGASRDPEATWGGHVGAATSVDPFATNAAAPW